jgi:uncharacterized membrane protein (UPF0127 family)
MKRTLQVIVFVVLVGLVVVSVGKTSYVGNKPDLTDLMMPADNQKRMHLQVANTEKLRSIGLSGRSTLAPDDGMLFVFDKPQHICMWARDMKFPLSVAFFDNAWNLINIEDMEAHSTEPHCSALPAQYAIEMNQGYFGSY